MVWFTPDLGRKPVKGLFEKQQIKHLYLSAILVCVGSIGQAACGPALETFLSCDIGRSGKTLNVCHDNDVVTYSFGHPGAPELALVETVIDIDYTPWPGVGSTIWEEVTFTNGGYSYTTVGAIHRTYPEDPDGEIEISKTGGVVVTRDDETVAELSCLPETIDFAWGLGLWDAKVAAGQVYDYRARVWNDSAE